MEALHLDEVLEATNVRQKDLADRLDESEQDRKWMRGQVEKLTKRNWALEKKLKDLGVDMSSLLSEEGDESEESGASEGEDGSDTDPIKLADALSIVDDDSKSKEEEM